MTDKIKCPKCGHDEVNVAIWGSSNLKNPYPGIEEIETNIVHVDIDHKDDSARCTKCEYEGHFSCFNSKTNDSPLPAGS